MKHIALFIAVILSFTACTAQTSNNMEKKILVAYFSATGTTKAQAEIIAKATGATICEITPATRYTDADLDWRDQNSRSSLEMKDEKNRPAVGGKNIMAKDYDIIFIGYPIWWDLCPRVVNTWIESQQIKGKTIIPFATSGGSSITNSQKTLRELYPELNWKDGQLLNCSAESTAEWAKMAIK